jgi:wyosine [tRNA(Phe)-imidazoG37] synthetase (radical SAM superfamily)
MQENKNLTFGPVNSRRFGISLGIDLSPSHKQCNFDCLYCELAPATTINKQTISYNVKDYIEAVQIAIKKNPEIEVITITANGEPTLYPYLDHLVDKLNKIKGNKKLLILSNSALITNSKIQRTLRKIDIVKLSLDCATNECFKKLDRVDNSIDCQKMIDSIFDFKNSFKNELIIEVLFVDTINNKKDELDKLYDILYDLNPTRIDIGTIDRPPAYNVKAISYEELKDIADSMSGLNISIAHKNKINLNKYLNNEEILNLLDKRPQTLDDINNLLDDKSKKLFDNLLKEEKIIIKNQAGVEFYARKK